MEYFYGVNDVRKINDNGKIEITIDEFVEYNYFKDKKEQEERKEVDWKAFNEINEMRYKFQEENKKLIKENKNIILENKNLKIINKRINKEFWEDFRIRIILLIGFCFGILLSIIL